MTKKRILVTKAKIKSSNYNQKILVLYLSNKSKYTFTYYEDELSFSEEEFIGLSHDQSMWLIQKKDTEYLRSL